MKCPRCLKGIMREDNPSRGILVWCKNCGLKLINPKNRLVKTKDVSSTRRNITKKPWGGIK